MGRYIKLGSEILQLEQQYADSDIEKKRILEEDAQKLRNAIERWKKQFLIVAPVAGHISLSKIWHSKQTVSAGEEILAIVPDMDRSVINSLIIGRASVSVSYSGKLKVGLPVIIRLDGFPVQEYGTVTATVSGISPIPQNEAYLIDVGISDSLVSSYQRKIPFRQEMTGSMKIITENKRMIDRILGTLRELVHNAPSPN